MSPASSACLCVNEWCRRTVSFINTEARDARDVFSLCRLNICVHKHINIVFRTALRVTS